MLRIKICSQKAKKNKERKLPTMSLFSATLSARAAEVYFCNVLATNLHSQQVSVFIISSFSATFGPKEIVRRHVSVDYSHNTKRETHSLCIRHVQQMQESWPQNSATEISGHRKNVF